MKRLLNPLVLAVILATLSFASAAEAKKLRSTAERRQRPGRGLFVETPRHHRPAVQRGFWDRNPFRFFWQPQATRATHAHRAHRSGHTHRSHRSNQSWGWQRSSRAELHHPGPRNRNR